MHDKALDGISANDSANRQLSRRCVLGTGAAAGTLALVGCSDDATDGASDGAAPGDTTAPGTTSPGAEGVVALADVPVGGAVSAIGPDGPVVIAQPTAGEAVAFSAICTHQGCTVAPDGAQLKCPCHGSVFEAATGKNVSGPATSPLPPVNVRVDGGEVVFD